MWTEKYIYCWMSYPWFSININVCIPTSFLFAAAVVVVVGIINLINPFNK